MGLVTPLRDGMNLVAKEYVATKEDCKSGALVLSEMAGAAAELDDALLINPCDHTDMANAIYKALEMPVCAPAVRLVAVFVRGPGRLQHPRLLARGNGGDQATSRPFEGSFVNGTRAPKPHGMGAEVYGSGQCLVAIPPPPRPTKVSVSKSVSSFQPR